MGWSLTLFRVGPTEVKVHVTFLIFLAWIGVSAAFAGGFSAAVDALMFIVALFACVVLHEFGHILAARRYGIVAPSVTLLPIGGVASLKGMPRKPSEELVVAIAGPLVNVVIALMLILLLGRVNPAALKHIDDPGVSLLARLAATNVFLAVFNLIPAFPMDGGRVLHALLAMRYGPLRATQMAASVGQALAFVLGFVGLFGNPLLIFIAIFVYVAAGAEAQEGALREAAQGLTVADAMETAVAALPMTASLGDAVDALVANAQVEFPLLDAYGKPAGVMTRADILSALKARDREAPVAELMRAPVATVRASSPLAAGLDRLAEDPAGAICAVDPDGVFAGLLTRQAIGEIFVIRSMKPDWRFAAHRR